MTTHTGPDQGKHDDRTVAVCNPTDGYSPQVLGCTRDHCMICAAEVWVAPSSRLLAKQFLCLDCAPGVLAAEGGTIEPPTPEQLDEIRHRRLP